MDYPKWVGTDPDDPLKGVTVHSAEEEDALLGKPKQAPQPQPAEDEAPKPFKPKK